METLALLDPSTFEGIKSSLVSPKDLVWEYIHVLSDLRGQQSYLVTELVQRSTILLGLDLPPHSSVSELYALQEEDVEDDSRFEYVA